MLVGPSGCGKTTALRMLAGLEDDHERADPDRRPRRQQRRPGRARRRDGLPVVRALPAHDRLRQPRLRPAQPQGAEGRDRPARAARRPRCSSSTPLLKRKPKQLSGGQRQRVALGRAIVREPAAFLMDEPLSNLDAALRVQTRAEILKLQQRLGTTTIYVTHDQVEAMTMGDRIAVMSKGVLQQIGTPEDLYTQPANTFVADVHRLAGDEPRARARWSASAARGPARRLPAGARRARQRRAGRRPPTSARSRSSSTSATSSSRTSGSGDTPIAREAPGRAAARTGGKHDQFAVPLDRLLLFDAESEQAVGTAA